MVRLRNYDEAKAYILKGRNKVDRPLGKNGRIHLRSDNFIEVHLYESSIIQYYKTDAGTQTMSVDGWYDSQTTQRRIENTCGIRVTMWNGVPILANQEYLDKEPDSENVYGGWAWAGDGRYGADHCPKYIADSMTRIRSDGSIVNEKRVRQRLNNHVRSSSAKAMKRVNDSRKRAIEAEWAVTQWLSRHAKECKEKLAKLDKLNKEIGYLEAKKEKSLKADKGLPGVHNRI